MKKRILASFLVIGFLGLVSYAAMGAKICAAQQKKATGPNVVVATPKVKMEKKMSVSISGSGFAPGQEIKMVFRDVNGVMTNIGNDLKPELKVDQNGAFKTSWNCSRMVGRKLIQEGSYEFTVTDSDYTPIAKAPVAFYK